MNGLRLASGGASATVLPGRGGLVSQLALAPGGKPAEVLWMPPDFATAESGWPGGGLPVLFPFAGRVFHDGQPFRYELDGAVRTMPIHGFAYGLPWTVAAQTGADVTLKLVDTPATHRLYPFAFELTARISLTEAALGVELTARHTGTSGAMPVALGLHPYFRLPPAARSGGRLVTHAATQVAVTNAGGAGKVSPLTAPDAAAGGIPLASPLTANVILADHATPEARLVDEAAGTAVTLGWDAAGPYRYVVLWRKGDEGFQCVEPWMALPDAVSAGPAAGAATGVAWLPPGERVTAAVRIALRRS